MSKDVIGQEIEKIRSENRVGENTKNRVADIFKMVLGEVPGLASVEGNSEADAVTQKAWTQKNAQLQTAINNVDANSFKKADVTQSTGTSTTKTMSQKAVTDLAATKFDKANIVDNLGQNTTKVVSQKGVDDALQQKFDKANLVNELGVSTSKAPSQKVVTDKLNTIEGGMVSLQDEIDKIIARYVAKLDVKNEYGNSTVDPISQKYISDELNAIDIRFDDVNNSFSDHLSNKTVHFNDFPLDPQGSPAHVDTIFTQGVYKYPDDNGVLLVSRSGNKVRQIDATGTDIKYRKIDISTIPHDPNPPTISEWQSFSQLASDSNSGLMSINHYKSLEDMITNFTALVESQNLIKAELKRIADKQTETYADEILIGTGAEAEMFTSFGINPLGNAKVKIEAGEVTTIRNVVGGRINTCNAVVPPKALIKVYSNNSGRFEIPSVTGVLAKYSYIQAISPTLQTLWAGNNGATLTYIDITSCPALKAIIAINTGLTTIDVTQNPELIDLYLYGAKITGTIDISKNTKLVTVPIYNNPGLTNLTIASSYPDLFRLSVHLTAIPLAKIMEMGAAWGDRTGKTSGSLQVSSTIYNAMTDEQKAVFANKNINITTTA